jgi:transcriptional repressor NF-X1
MADTLPPPSATPAGPSRPGPSAAGQAQAQTQGPPQPGDGAYLRYQQTQSQRGRGRGAGSAPSNRGRGNGRGRGGHNGQMNGGHPNGQDGPSSRQPPPHQHNGHGDNLPHRPQAPESLHGLAEAATHQVNAGRGKSAERGHRARGRGKGNGSAQANGSTNTPTILDAGAPSFQPLSAPHTPQIGSEVEDNARTQSERGKARPKSKPRQARPTKTPDVPRTPAAPAPVNSRSSRRAAFDQGAKLTKTVSASSTGSHEKKEFKPKEKRSTSEADDLIDRLTRGLGKRPFLECPICYNSIIPSQQIWCCLPPDSPPPSPFAVGIDVIDPKVVASHYQACYTPFHYNCVKDWSRRNYEEDQARLRMIDSQEEAVWRCPGCQKRRADRIPPYRYVAAG